MTLECETTFKIIESLIENWTFNEIDNQLSAENILVSQFNLKKYLKFSNFVKDKSNIQSKAKALSKFELQKQPIQPSHFSKFYDPLHVA